MIRLLIKVHLKKKQMDAIFDIAIRKYARTTWRLPANGVSSSSHTAAVQPWAATQYAAFPYFLPFRFFKLYLLSQI